MMKNFAVLSYLTNIDICLTKNFAVLSYLTNSYINSLMKNFAVLCYLPNRDIWSDEEGCCMLLSCKQRYMDC